MMRHSVFRLALLALGCLSVTSTAALGQSDASESTKLRRLSDPPTLSWDRAEFLYLIDGRPVASLTLKNSRDQKTGRYELEDVVVREGGEPSPSNASSPVILSRRHVCESNLFLTPIAVSQRGQGAEGVSGSIVEGSPRTLALRSLEGLRQVPVDRALSIGTIYRAVTLLPFRAGSKLDFDLLQYDRGERISGQQLTCDGKVLLRRKDRDFPAWRYRWTKSTDSEFERIFWVGIDRSLLLCQLDRSTFVERIDRAEDRQQRMIEVDPKSRWGPRTIDDIIGDLYETISGDAGVERDWDRFRDLFHPLGKLIPIQASPGRQASPRFITPDEYIELTKPVFAQRGFHEIETKREVHRFGHLAQVWSTYEGRGKADDKKPFLRGINSIQLVFDGRRWRVLNITWQAETKQHPLPKRFLPAPR